MRISRRSFFLAGTAAVPGGICYACFGEPNWLEVTRTEIRTGKTPLTQRVKILHLSDFHLSSDVPLSLIARAIELGVAEKPDVICLTGDFVTGQLSQEKEYAAVLAKLAKAAPTYASFGNHDGGEWARGAGGYDTTEPMRQFLEGAGIRALRNESVTLRSGATTIRLTGLCDLWAGDFAPEKAFSPVLWHTDLGAAPQAHVVMSHNPDTKDDLKKFEWDLLLCGHTHGGQVSLPFIGGAAFVPLRDRRFISGRYDWDNRQIYVTRGVGNILGIRFNCRPEVSLLTLA